MQSSLPFPQQHARQLNIKPQCRNDPISYAEITEQKILVRPTLANPEIEDLNKMQSQSFRGCGSGLPSSLGLHSFPQLFPGLGHGLSLSHEWAERGQSPNVDIAPGHPLHLSPTAMGIWHPKSSVLCKSLHRCWLFCLNVCFRLPASLASAIMTLVLLSTGNVGCFQGSGWNEGKGLFISLQRVWGTTSAQVVKFPLSRA